MRTLLRVATLAAFAVVCAACSGDGPPQAPPHTDRFAKAYIAALYDTSYAAVAGMTTQRTLELPDFRVGLERMRRLLPAGGADSAQLRALEVLHAVDEPPTAHVVYIVRGVGVPAEVELWIEEPKGAPPRVETVRVTQVDQ